MYKKNRSLMFQEWCMDQVISFFDFSYFLWYFSNFHIFLDFRIPSVHQRGGGDLSRSDTYIESNTVSPSKNCKFATNAVRTRSNRFDQTTLKFGTFNNFSFPISGWELFWLNLFERVCEAFVVAFTILSWTHCIWLKISEQLRSPLSIWKINFSYFFMIFF